MRIVLTALLLTVCICAISGCRTYVPQGMAGASQEDLQIVDDVTNRLEADSLMGKFTFGITCKDGVVTIQGAIPDDVLRARALGIVKGTPGVQGVVDKLYRYNN